MEAFALENFHTFKCKIMQNTKATREDYATLRRKSIFQLYDSKTVGKCLFKNSIAV